MLYILDTQASPPVIVLQARESDLDPSGHLAVAQRYADQTSHVLVVAQGPDAVRDPQNPAVVHPTAHAPRPTVAPAASGVMLAPAAAAASGVMLAPAAAASAGSLWQWLESEWSALEPTVKQVVEPILQSLLSKLVSKL